MPAVGKSGPERASSGGGLTMERMRAYGARNAQGHERFDLVKRGKRARLLLVVCLSVVFYLAGSVRSSASQDEQVAFQPAGVAGRAQALRDAIAARVGSLDKLRVSIHNTDLPQPLLADGISPDPRFAITEAKRYLGKQLFFDPVRTNRIRPAC